MTLMENNGAGGHGAKRAVGERSGGATGRGEPDRTPNPELVERPKRRRFSAEYKLSVLARPPEIGPPVVRVRG